MQYSLNEICLLPSKFPTDITSRSQVNPFNNGKLPIFVSPMTSIIDENNIKLFDDANVIPILPRNLILEKRLELSKKYWVAFSLQEFIYLFNDCKAAKITEKYHVLIDIANGHMKQMYEACKNARKEYKDQLEIMVGNIAHPAMYLECCINGIDYVRVGIGGGSVCSTSVQCGIHSSHQWMIEQIKGDSKFYNDPDFCKYYPLFKKTKIIADGGINTIDKAIKCLAIGYDYVMMGKQFAQCEEACGERNLANPNMRKYYGMASEQGQIDISGGFYKNPEGIETLIEVNTNLKEYTTKFEAALRSTMSYTGAHNLKEFRSNTQYDIMSIEEFKSYYK